MKDSGVKWIGEIPDNWEVKPYKYFAYNRMGETILTENLKEYGIPVYSATQEDKILGYIDKAKVLLKNGDFVIPARGNSIGNVTYITDDLATCTQTTICSYNIHNIKNKFLFYCAVGLKDYWFEFEGSAQPQITVNQVNNNTVPVPPIHEQEKIANFLDEKCEKIDSIISNEKSLIEKYKSYKSSLITETVTKGLNPNVEYKDTNIDYIGSIPKHWTIKPLKYVTNFQEGPGILGNDFKESGIPLIRISGMKDFYVSKEGCNYLDENKVEKKWKHFKLKLNDLVISASATLGIVAIVNHDTVGCIPYTGLIRFPINKFIYNIFLKYFLLSNLYLEQIELQKKGSTIQHYGPTHLNKVKILLPQLNEQKEIADYLDEKCEKIDKIVKLKEEKINKLNEYKKSLIYEYVTGKKKAE